MLEDLTASAQILSAAATDDLLERLDRPRFRAELRACGSEAAELSSKELVERLRREVAVAEVASNFQAVPQTYPGFPFVGMSLEEGRHGAGFFESQWESGVFHNISFGRRGWSPTKDMIERDSYGLRPFAAAGRPTTMHEAQERAPYFGVNLFRVDAGSPLYGDVSVVLRPSVAWRSAEVAAVDSGGRSTFCRPHPEKQEEKMASDPNFRFPNCKAFSRSTGMGTLMHVDHLFLANERYWHADMSRVACRLLGEIDNTTFRGPDLSHYWEVLPLEELTYPASIKFLIGSFPSLFGTAAGAQLQEWCIATGWVLIWTLGLNLGDYELNFFSVLTLKHTFRGSQRVVDPLVLQKTRASTNLTISDAVPKAFSEQWLEVNTTREQAAAQGIEVSNSTWAEAWTNLTATAVGGALRLAPLRAASCEDADNCVGTLPTGDCLCYLEQATTQASLIVT